VRALISVHDKTGLVPFARGLADLGFELVASGGTATFLADEGIRVSPVETITDFPEILGGRVKTLHPRVHAGILARRGLEEDLDDLAANGIEPFHLVCVNLYPFELVAARLDAADGQIAEMIDVGGPSLLRAAAKNHAVRHARVSPRGLRRRPRRAPFARR
jgi:phosphoribosylaminoimidazolecarboxamide formyltransferase/IMP cyclohydrolase